MDYNDIRQVENRVKRYWYEDGVVEPAGGGLCILLALYYIAQELLALVIIALAITKAGFTCGRVA